MKFVSQLCALTLVCVLTAADARAELLRSGTKASSVELGLGVMAGMNYSGAAFDLHLNYAHHFSGDASGFALGVAFDIVADPGAGVTLFAPAVRGNYDFEVSNAIYLSPFTAAGFVIGTTGVFAFNSRVGLGVKVLLNDRFLATLQPLGIDITAGSNGVVVSYNLLFGGGLTF